METENVVLILMNFMSVLTLGAESDGCIIFSTNKFDLQVCIKNNKKMKITMKRPADELQAYIRLEKN